ncbi:hypothetical protein H0H81_006065 [Sphagnurus paluster]|uniref:Uncharacterized protein n=1 Tax=Sphagnurus paluster TaxID=117069 RepID=A0A9P7FN33_9AGAR|nr:hypothetical protein H0H81_006065 [Sphagnurus paluster]
MSRSNLQDKITEWHRRLKATEAAPASSTATETADRPAKTEKAAAAPSINTEAKPESTPSDLSAQIKALEEKLHLLSQSLLQPPPQETSMVQTRVASTVRDTSQTQQPPSTVSASDTAPPCPTLRPLQTTRVSATQLMQSLKPAPPAYRSHTYTVFLQMKPIDPACRETPSAKMLEADEAGTEAEAISVADASEIFDLYDYDLPHLPQYQEPLVEISSLPPETIKKLHRSETWRPGPRPEERLKPKPKLRRCHLPGGLLTFTVHPLLRPAARH